MGLPGRMSIRVREVVSNLDGRTASWLPDPFNLALLTPSESVSPFSVSVGCKAYSSNIPSKAMSCSSNKAGEVIDRDATIHTPSPAHR